MTMVLGICYVLVTVAEKQLALYVTISTSGCDGWLQQRNCHGIDAVWTRRAARDCSGVDAKGVNCDHLDQPDPFIPQINFTICLWVQSTQSTCTSAPVEHIFSSLCSRSKRVCHFMILLHDRPLTLSTQRQCVSDVHVYLGL